MVPVLNTIGTDVACVGVSTNILSTVHKLLLMALSCRTTIWILALNNSDILQGNAHSRGCLQMSWVAIPDYH